MIRVLNENNGNVEKYIYGTKESISAPKYHKHSNIKELHGKLSEKCDMAK